METRLREQTHFTTADRGFAQLHLSISLPDSSLHHLPKPNFFFFNPTPLPASYFTQVSYRSFATDFRKETISLAGSKFLPCACRTGAARSLRAISPSQRGMAVSAADSTSPVLPLEARQAPAQSCLPAKALPAPGQQGRRVTSDLDTHTEYFESPHLNRQRCI